MGDLVSMGTKLTSSAVLQTMLHVPPPLWQNQKGTEHSPPGKCAQPSIRFLVPTPFQQQSPGGGFKDVQPSSYFQVASFVMLFETGMFYMMMINIHHVSQCFFKLSVKLSGNINSCLFFIVVMPLLQILNRSMYFLHRKINIMDFQFVLFNVCSLLIPAFIIHLISARKKPSIALNMRYIEMSKTAVLLSKLRIQNRITKSAICKSLW